MAIVEGNWLPNVSVVVRCVLVPLDLYCYHTIVASYNCYYYDQWRQKQTFISSWGFCNVVGGLEDGWDSILNLELDLTTSHARFLARNQRGPNEEGAGVRIAGAHFPVLFCL